jgi:DNA-binding PadR family transcriptional regulator
MSAKHAVLGLVIERPGYGYQLAQRLEERCGAWGWEPSGVYNALDQLKRERHVRAVGEKGSRGTDRGAPRVVYESTSRGVEFFEDWMSKSSALSPFRQELDLKIVFSGPECLAGLIDQTWAQEQVCINDLRALTTPTQVGSGDRMASWREAAVILQRDAEIMLLQARIEWLQNARKTMKTMLDRFAGDQRVQGL